MRTGKRAILIAISVAPAALVTAPAAHADSAPPCGTVITSDFVLSGDMYCPTGSALIVGGVAGTTVDLGGHQLVGGGGTSGFNSGVSVTGNRDVTVMNGTIIGFDFGVFAAGGSPDDAPNTLKDLRLTGNRIGFVGLSASRARVVGNRIDANGTGLSLVFNARATVAANLIEDNRSCGADHTESSGNVYERNVIRNNGDCGIRSFIGGNNTIMKNNISGHVVGVSIGHVNSRGNQVVDNQVFDNDVGLRIGGGTLADHVDGTVVSKNRFLKNHTTGLLFTVAAGSVDGSTISGNVFVGTAAGDGLHADVAPGLGEVTVLDNVAVRNADLGIEAVGVVDGGGNGGHANGNPLQCVGVAC